MCLVYCEEGHQVTWRWALVNQKVVPEWTGLHDDGSLDKKWQQGLHVEIILLCERCVWKTHSVDDLVLVFEIFEQGAGLGKAIWSFWLKNLDLILFEVCVNRAVVLRNYLLYVSDLGEGRSFASVANLQIRDQTLRRQANSHWKSFISKNALILSQQLQSKNGVKHSAGGRVRETYPVQELWSEEGTPWLVTNVVYFTDKLKMNRIESFDDEVPNSLLFETASLTLLAVSGLGVFCFFLVLTIEIVICALHPQI